MVYVVVSTHAHIWLTMYYSCICQARVHANEAHEMCGKNTRDHGNQNTRVQFMQTKCMSAVRANQRCTHPVP